MAVEYDAIEFETASEAIQHAKEAGWDRAITIDGKHVVVSAAGCEQLETARIPFAYRSAAHRGGGTEGIVSVPVN
ncbi:MAG TPA: hypothetical protein PK093_18055 [Phycisphaerae bacterium]|nr:hypothetical protein [Phycisphaerae bacterium]